MQNAFKNENIRTRSVVHNTIKTLNTVYKLYSPKPTRGRQEPAACPDWGF